jgi:hypothetical protein
MQETLHVLRPTLAEYHIRFFANLTDSLVDEVSLLPNCRIAGNVAATWRGLPGFRVDGFGQRFEFHAALLEVVEDGYQVAQAAA